MRKSLKIACIGQRCVACGNCVPACPLHAIHIHLGITAHVDSVRCVGCGKCVIVCPAAVIAIREATR